MFVRDSGAGNGCANFMDEWKNAFFSAGKTHVHKIPRFRQGGGWVLGGGGGKCRFYFYGREDFSDSEKEETKAICNPNSTAEAYMGDRLVSSAGAGRSFALPMRLPRHSPVLDKVRGGSNVQQLTCKTQRSERSYF